MKSRLFLIGSCLVLISTMAITARGSLEPTGAGDQAPGIESEQQGFACGGEPCDAVVRGSVAFFDRRLRGLGGNGRACADCHMAADHFQLSPKDVEARFQFLGLRRLFDPQADDPLFRPIDADDFRANGDRAHDFSNLRQNGLVRITFALPSNIRLIDPATNLPSDEASVDVWRMVPTVNDVALTGADTENPWARLPNPFGGYQLDGRIATLQDQALGALTNHAQVQQAPPQRFLDDVASFQRVLFTNGRVRALSDAIRAGTTPLPDPDPSLNALERKGKIVFERACAQCHGSAGESNSPAPNTRFHDIGTQCPRAVDFVTPARFVFAACPPRLARNARTYQIALSIPTPTPTPTGVVLLPARSLIRRTSSDPGRAFQTGFVGGAPPFDDWNKFDMPGLRGIRNTAPYFHNNSADTLEAVVDHYIQLFNFIKAFAPPGPPPFVASTDGVTFNRQPQPEERAALLAYLRKL